MAGNQELTKISTLQEISFTALKLKTIDVLNKIKENPIYMNLFIKSFENKLYFSSIIEIEIACEIKLFDHINYLYFDMAWMGWPIVHNGKFCKEVGYYYDEFNYEMGGNMLKDVILNHDENADEYLLKNRLYMLKYLPTNKELKKQYEDLITSCLASE